MNILLISPQPLYQDRGTPIAVDMILKVLSERGEEVDVVAYHEGRELQYPHVTMHRIPNLPLLRHIRPGFSWKKIVCDAFLLFKIMRLVSSRRYHVVHAVEESTFIALLVKHLLKIPYIYDMDSSLAQQMVEKFPFLAPLNFVFNAFERVAVKNAKAVVPVCEALAANIEEYRPEKVVILHDVSLLEEEKHQSQINLKTELGIEGILFMYVGNLEAYQGIDLLLESFALTLKKTDQAKLVIIGGEAVDIQRYRKKSRYLSIDQRVHFLGPKPVGLLAMYLSQADVLVSPRIKGKNTPMKIYSYLHSQRSILATNLPTHTQILNTQVSLLVEPAPNAFSEGMLRLIEDPTLRSKLGVAGKQLVEEKHTYAVFRKKLNGLYDWLSAAIGQEHGPIANGVESALLATKKNESLT